MKRSLACLLCSGGIAASIAGEKIQFDLPTERDEQPVAVQERAPRASAPASFNNSAAAPAQMYRPQSRPAPVLDKKAREEWEKKKNWLSADPSATPSIEEIFKIKEFSSQEDNKPTFLGKTIEAPRTVAPETQSSRSFDESSQGPSFRSLNLPSTALDRAWSPSASENRLTGFERPNNLGDFWNNKGTVSAFAPTQPLRSQIANVLDSRTEPQINSFLDNGRQPANPLVGVGAETFGRESLKSFTDQWKENVSPQIVQRSSVLDTFKPQSVGRVSTQTEFTPAASTWIKPKPASLPFPARPGELFR